MSACGNDGGKNAPANSSNSNTDSTLSGEVVYWSMWNENEPQAEVLREAADDFEAKNPNVKIKIQWSGREIRKTLLPALEANQTIDMWDEDAERVVKSYEQYSLKLDDYFAQTYPTTDGKSYRESVISSLVDLTASFSTDGGIYAIPYQPMILGFMYNKDHFDKAGITSVPTTWSEFMDVSAKLKDAGYIPLTVDDAYIDLPVGYHLARHIGVENVINLMQDKTGTLWDDAKVLKAVKEYEALAINGYVSPSVATNKWPAGQQEVALGKVSMYLNGTWLPNELMAVTGEEFRWGQFPYPAVDGGVDGTEAGTYGSQAFQINKNSKVADAAFAFAVHMTTGEWDAELSKRTYGAPVSNTNDWPVQIEETKDMLNKMSTWYPWGAGAQADADKLPILNANFTNLITGKITAEQFISNLKANKS